MAKSSGGRKQAGGKGGTPAVVALQAAGVAFELHQFEHDPTSRSFGSEAAEVLGIDPARVFKTLVAGTDRGLVVGIVPVDRQLSMKALAAAAGAKRAEMAELTAVERSTGYVRGGISPFGQKRRLPTVLDASAARFATILVSGGRRGLEIEVAPADLIAVLDATSAEVAI